MILKIKAKFWDYIMAQPVVGDTLVQYIRILVK